MCDFRGGGEAGPGPRPPRALFDSLVGAESPLRGIAPHRPRLLVRSGRGAVQRRGMSQPVEVGRRPGREGRALVAVPVVWIVAVTVVDVLAPPHPPRPAARGRSRADPVVRRPPDGGRGGRPRGGRPDGHRRGPRPRRTLLRQPRGPDHRPDPGRRQPRRLLRPARAPGEGTRQVRYVSEAAQRVVLPRSRVGPARCAPPPAPGRRGRGADRRGPVRGRAHRLRHPADHRRRTGQGHARRPRRRPAARRVPRHRPPPGRPARTGLRPRPQRPVGPGVARRGRGHLDDDAMLVVGRTATPPT